MTIGERIGSGCFAEVHKGQVKLDTNEVVDCAIKVRLGLGSSVYEKMV